MSPPSISVIIPTLNRPLALEACLDALAAQTQPGRTFEVVVVDDGSSPPLDLDASRWAHAFDLLLIRQEKMGPGGARNTGVTAARGEWLAFTDDDCLPTPIWLKTMVEALERHPSAIVGGSTFNGLPYDLYAETSQLVIELAYEHFNSGPGGAYFFASNNVAVRRDLHMALCGFDAGFRFIGAEDRDWCDRWRLSGRSLVWERCAIVEHRHAQTLRQFVRLHWRYGRGAFRYQRLRRSRASGTMAEDLGFHRHWPRAALQKRHRYPPTARLVIARNLCIWQIANAGGFIHEWIVGNRSGRRGTSQDSPSCGP